MVVIANKKLAVTSSTSAWIIAIIMAVIAGLTYIQMNLTPETAITNPIIIGAVVAALLALLKAIPVSVTPTPTPAPTA